MKPIMNDKIAKLTSKLQDKTLTREEKREIMKDLSWEKFRADTRPAMPLKKFKLLDAFVFLGDAIIFSYIGLVDKSQGFTKGDFLVVAVTLLLIAMVCLYFYIHNKYKIEPADELAERNLSRASKFAFLTLAAILLAAAFVMAVTDPRGTLTIKNNSMLNLICSAVFIYSFLSNLIFVILEGRQAAEEAE